MRKASEGDVLIHVSCCDIGPVLVLSTMRPDWRCGSCRSTGTDGQRYEIVRTYPTPDKWDHGVLTVVPA